MKYLILLPLLLLMTDANAGVNTATTGRISKSGNCTCKSRCDQFAKQGQYSPVGLAQRKKSCQEKWSGCNAGSYYGRY